MTMLGRHKLTYTHRYTETGRQTESVRSANNVTYAGCSCCKTLRDVAFPRDTLSDKSWFHDVISTLDVELADLIHDTQHLFSAEKLHKMAYFSGGWRIYYLAVCKCEGPYQTSQISRQHALIAYSKSLDSYVQIIASILDNNNNNDNHQAYIAP